jgi:hypothetical protein
MGDMIDELKTRRTRGSTSVLSYQVRSVAATGWASLANALLMFDQTSWSHGGRAADGLYTYVHAWNRRVDDSTLPSMHRLVCFGSSFLRWLNL